MRRVMLGYEILLRVDWVVVIIDDEEGYDDDE